MASLLAYFSSPSPKPDTVDDPAPPTPAAEEESTKPPAHLVPEPVSLLTPDQGDTSLSAQRTRSEQSAVAGSTESAGSPGLNGERVKRRFSFRSMGFIAAQDEVKVIHPKADTDSDKGDKEAMKVKRKEGAGNAKAKAKKEKPKKLSREDRHALEAALTVRAVIVGPFANASRPPISGSKAKAGAASPGKPAVEKAKARLGNPKTANRIIAHLKTLPASQADDGDLGSEGEPLATAAIRRVPAPIHAVALDCTEAEADERHFAQLGPDDVSVEVDTVESQQGKEAAAEKVVKVASVATASAAALSQMFSGIRLVSLFGADGDFGLGKPASEPGVLSGAVPTAEEVMKGIEQVTPQLMALGYATGQAVYPNHAGIHPPIDRMSVITYWWGLELNLPHASVQYLANVPSISHSVINFLTALSVADQGVREIIPFVRYISQFVDWEYNTIKAQDKGKGVVCAATWLMPAAMIPRAWDYEDPPPTSSLPDIDPSSGPVLAVPVTPLAIASTDATSAAVAPTPSPSSPVVPQLTVTPPTLPRSAGAAMRAVVS